jgi:hypothetical protein
MGADGVMFNPALGVRVKVQKKGGPRTAPNNVDLFLGAN